MYTISPFVDGLTFRWFASDLDMRSRLISNSVNDVLVVSIQKKSTNRITKLFTAMLRDERLYGLGICNVEKKLVHATTIFPPEVNCGLAPNTARESKRKIVDSEQGPLLFSFQPILDSDKWLGHLVVVHDMAFVEKRSGDTKRYVLYLFLLVAAIMSVVTVAVAQWSWKGWIKSMRSLIRGDSLSKSFAHLAAPELKPIAKDLRALIRDLENDRKTRDVNHVNWSPKALKDILQQELTGDEVIIVSNREPYIHQRKDGKIETQLPASGVVTALEPVMRACSGTWIAHGSGNADKELVDKFDRVRVPPEDPSYNLRRVWLTQEQEQGYYYGFANEGLWPLCHIAHTRPIFRAEDWKHYCDVNQKFADTVIEEAKTKDPVILVQDYHFALLPRLIKKKLPNATIITFWHIPWPNPEAFGICPWREEILDGLLGSSILGFHTRFHCNNFIDTVDRFIESRIDRETSTISFRGETTAVNRYPISIEWPSRWVKGQKSIAECRVAIREFNRMSMDRKVGIGVDRLDYTKGILERFYAIERFLELNPEWVGKFSFIQIAAPSRSSIEHYQQFDKQVRSLAEKINSRFGFEGYEPICLKIEHHDPEQVYEHFRASDVCFVSSLHDGMNLVAKEFVAAREDELGVLILSQFTGASREMPQALIINPYNIDQCAAALRVAVEMSETEQRDRMRSMRGLIQEYNVYRWAGRMLMGASRLRRHNRFLGKFGDSELLLKTTQEL